MERSVYLFRPLDSCSSTPHGCSELMLLISSTHCIVVKYGVWWHCIFFFLLDLTVVNTYIIYLHYCQDVPRIQLIGTPLTHLEFKMGLYKALLQDWSMQQFHPSDLPPPSDLPTINTPSYNSSQMLCVVYKRL